jgi:hypothetical protein
MFVKRLLRGLDVLPRWLRWAVFLPVGLCISYFVEIVLEILLDIAGLPDVHVTVAGSVRTAVIRFVGGFTVTVFPALLSPRPWPVGIVMLAAGILVRLSTIAYGLAFMRYVPSRMFLVGGFMVVYALGGLLGLYLIRRSVPFNDGRQPV